MKPGIYDISNKEYHASEGISRSALLDMTDPLVYWENHVNPNRKPRKVTKEMIIGNMVHTLVLEPHLFEKEYVFRDKVDGRTTEGKAYNAQFEVVAAGRKIIMAEGQESSENINYSWFELASNICIAINANANYQVLSDGAQIEKSFYWIDEDTGFLLKARPDILNEEMGIICDLKTTNSKTADDFRWDCKRYGYHMQAAMQIDGAKANGIEIKKFFNMPAPKESPHMPFLYPFHENVIDSGRQQYKDALRLLKTCLATNQWSTHRDQPVIIAFNSFQLINPFQNLLEVYQCQQN